MNDYKIKLTGLKDGNYSNSFKIRDEFFEAFEKSEIKFIDIKADTLLEINQENMSVEISLDGVYKDVQCDICTERIDVPLSTKTNYIIQKGLESTFFDDNIIYINENEKNINLTNVFYDMIVLAFPTKRHVFAPSPIYPPQIPLTSNVGLMPCSASLRLCFLKDK